MYVCMYVCYVCICLCMYVCMYVMCYVCMLCMYMFMYVCMLCMCMFMYVYMYVCNVCYVCRLCMYICMYVCYVCTNVATGGRFFLDGHDKLYAVVWFTATECQSACSCSVRPLTFLWELSNARRSSWMEREGCFLLLDLISIFRSFRKISKSEHYLDRVCVPVCLPLRMEHLGSHSMGFPWNLTFEYFCACGRMGWGLVHSHSFSRKLHLACTNLM